MGNRHLHDLPSPADPDADGPRLDVLRLDEPREPREPSTQHARHLFRARRGCRLRRRPLQGRLHDGRSGLEDDGGGGIDDGLNVDGQLQDGLGHGPLQDGLGHGPLQDGLFHDGPLEDGGGLGAGPLPDDRLPRIGFVCGFIAFGCHEIRTPIFRGVIHHLRRRSQHDLDSTVGVDGQRRLRHPGPEALDVDAASHGSQRGNN